MDASRWIRRFEEARRSYYYTRGNAVLSSYDGAWWLEVGEVGTELGSFDDRDFAYARACGGSADPVPMVDASEVEGDVAHALPRTSRAFRP